MKLPLCPSWKEKLAAKEIERKYVKKCNKREYKRKKKKISSSFFFGHQLYSFINQSFAERLSAFSFHCQHFLSQYVRNRIAFLASLPVLPGIH